jgi:Lon protease-like protein
VATHQRTPEGTYNVLLLGVRRLRLVRELPPKKVFRVVEAELMDDHLPDDVPAEAAAALQQRLLAAFKQAMPKIPDAYEQLDQLLGAQITLGMLADIVAYTLDLDLEWKMRLLEAIATRPAAAPARRFPPEFSVN